MNQENLLLLMTEINRYSYNGGISNVVNYMTTKLDFSEKEALEFLLKSDVFRNDYCYITSKLMNINQSNCRHIPVSVAGITTCSECGKLLCDY